jgi:class 3 adenylate cyclase
MQQIADWLEKLGMSEYAQRFAENGIDFSVLRHLTDQDLKDIGILLRHRRKMLAAIAEVAGAEQTSLQPALTASKPQDTAERRQVTVMFSDLVGSTALSARMDPEDLREVISAYQTCVAETVQRFGGFVAKYMGDGVLVYFGYPQAHEDDAERAVKAGLELIQAVSGLKAKAALQTRVGIATGLVVVGDLIGSGGAQEQAVIGETPNLTARLQGTAEPNTVLIAESTRRLLGNLFDLQDLGAQDLKGIAGPVRAWAALRPASVESRFEALHASGLIGSNFPSAVFRIGERSRSGSWCTSAIATPLAQIKPCERASFSSPRTETMRSPSSSSASPQLASQSVQPRKTVRRGPVTHSPSRRVRPARSDRCLDARTSHNHPACGRGHALWKCA